MVDEGGQIRNIGSSSSAKHAVLWLMYFLYKNEYKVFQPAEITIRMGQR
jgi:hypothetical protein